MFTFGGGAWYHAFYFGVGSAIADMSADRSDASVRFCGVSAGCLVASGLAFESNMEELFDAALSTFPISGRNAFKAVKCTTDSIEQHLPPEEAVHKVSQQKRLLVGVSRARGGLTIMSLRPRSICQFRDGHHLQLAQSASVRIPILGGFRGILIDGERCWDGQLTQNWSCLPVFDDVSEGKDVVIRITAYHDEKFSDLKEGWITPRIALPPGWQLRPHSVEALRLLHRLGYLRTLEYLAEFSKHSSLVSTKFRKMDADRTSTLSTEIQEVISAIEQKAQEKT